MISKQHRFSLCVIVPVLLGVLVDVSGGMMSIQLIPQYPVIGRSVTLSITGITGRIQNFIWYKGPNTDREYQILTYFPGHSSPLIPGPLFHSRMTPFPNGSLQISNLNITDEGNYIVRIQTDKASDTPVYLKIYDMVGKPNITASSSLPKENDTVTLTCTSTNAEMIVWSGVPFGANLPSGATLSPDNRTVSFSRIKRSDSGDYKCQASNLVSEKTSDPITITVAYGPENVKVKAKRSPSNSLISLECSADSVPPATYHWSLNGTDIKNQQSQLQVDQKKAEEEGTYTCVANNKVTQLTAKDSIYVNATIEPTDSDNGNTSETGNLGLIIGIVIAVILLLVLVAALVYLFVVHRRRKKLDQSSTKSKNSSRNGQTNPSEAAPEPELQYADIVFSKNMPRKQQPQPDVVYANRAELVRPQETVYSDLRLN